MSNKWGKPRKNIKNNRDPRHRWDEYQMDPDEEDYSSRDCGSNQENIEKLKQRKVLKETQGQVDPGSLFKNFLLEGLKGPVEPSSCLHESKMHPAALNWIDNSDPDIDVSTRENRPLTNIEKAEVLAAIHSFLTDKPNRAPPSLGFPAPLGDDPDWEDAFIKYYRTHPEKLEHMILQTDVIDVEAGPDDDLANTMQAPGGLYDTIRKLGIGADIGAPQVVKTVLQNIQHKASKPKREGLRVDEGIFDWFKTSGKASLKLPHIFEKHGDHLKNHFIGENKWRMKHLLHMFSKFPVEKWDKELEKDFGGTVKLTLQIIDKIAKANPE